MSDLSKLDQQYVWHPFTHPKLWAQSDPLVIVAADGPYLIDENGKKYLDGVSSLWCNVHGHQVPEINHAIQTQLKKVAHTTLLGLTNEPATLLAQQLIQIAPPGLGKVFYSDSGATATEIAFKIAVQYWHNLNQPRHHIVAIQNAYHGDTFGAMSVAPTPQFHQPFYPLLFQTLHAPSPHPYQTETPDNPELVKQNCLAELENLLKQHAPTVAAVALEPIVQGAAGIIVHPEGYLQEVRRLATKYNTLLIADEVATGFGRTAKMFACNHENVSPDILCLAKGITGGYLPLAATLTTNQIHDAFVGDPSENKTFFHGHTYTGNPLAAAAALASLELFKSTNLLEKVAQSSSQLHELLRPLAALRGVGQIRQKGLMAGIQLTQNQNPKTPFPPALRLGAQICQSLRRHGIILRPLGDVIVIMPPLTISHAHLQTIVNATAEEIAKIN